MHMSGHLLIESISLFLSGILAGEEFIVRYGLQPAIAKLDDKAHIQARVALVKRLRFVVPAIMVPTVILAILALTLTDSGSGILFRWLGAVSLVAFLLISFLGTVPINIKVIEWDAGKPPEDWKSVVKRWELLDVFRSTAAMLAFAFFIISIALQVKA
jgi:hypothetical protein